MHTRQFGKILILRIMFVSLISLILSTLLPVHTFATDYLEGIFNLKVNQRWTGNYQQMVQNRSIRILIPYSKTFYFLDKATQRGATYDMVKEFEKTINNQLETHILKVNTIFIPTSRERLIPALIEGLGDIAVGNLTITAPRLQHADFCDPFETGIDEILVTGPNSPSITKVEDLCGQEIHVRKSSSYYESLKIVNKAFTDTGKDRIKIIETNDNLEDEDLLEMLNAGLIPMMVIDSHKGQFWTQIFENIKPHPGIIFRKNGEIAWAIRKKSPELKKVINNFVKSNKKGTLMGNMIFNRYLKNTKYIKNNLASKDRKKFEEAVHLFKKYGKIYKFDWLMLAALAYQESNIDQSKRSHDGAIGVMQILPTTAKDKNVGISDIGKIEPNIHAGTKYLRFMMNRYFNNPAIDMLNQTLLTFAAYNAGPAKISKLRKEAKSLNLDPNVWFQNVEIVAAKRIGRETVQYVSNIFKYYIAYTFIIDQSKAKDIVGN